MDLCHSPVQMIMPPLAHLQVFQALHGSSNARLELCAELGDGMAAALWSNHHDAQDYEGTRHHTLSCYMAGGTGTFRRERPDCKGSPDKLCILPAGHDSQWVINGEIRLAHLYFGETQFAHGCVSLLDREPRELHLREETFIDDAQQAARFRRLVTLDWREPGERVLTSSLAHEMLGHALLTQVGIRDGLRLKGGLAAHHRRRLVEFIDAQLADPLSLGSLAQLCSLSEYHFARMFRRSFGMPPHQYVLARRLLRARQLLQSTALPLGEVALACGFASASHFAHRFGQTLKVTPGEYRQALRG